VANAPSPPIGPITPFWGWYLRLDRIASNFHDTAERIASIWLIGSALCWPFLVLSGAFYGARDQCGEANDMIRRMKSWLDGIISGTTFGELLDHLQHTFRQLRSDPAGWVRDRMRDVSRDLWSITLNARAWLEGKIGSSYPFIHWMAIDASGWLRALLSSTFGWGATILIDPSSYIGGVVRSQWPVLMNFAAHPAEMVASIVRSCWRNADELLSDPRGFVIRVIRRYNPEIGEFLDDPRSWLGRHICEALGVVYQADLGVARSVLWGMLWFVSRSAAGVLERFGSVLCDLIVRFV